MVVTKFKQRYPRNDNAKRDCCTKQEQNTPPITPLSKSCNSSSILSRDGTKKEKKKRSAVLVILVVVVMWSSRTFLHRRSAGCSRREVVS